MVAVGGLLLATGGPADAASAPGRCGGNQPPHGPVLTTVTPPDSVLSQFAVLRRAQTPDDQLAGIRGLLGDELASYSPALVRRLAPAPGGGFYLIAGVTPRRKPVPASCYRGLTPGQRRRIRRFEALLLARAGQPAYCILRVTSTRTPRDQTTNTESSCSPFAQIASVFALAGEAHGNQRSVWGLAPDGVATVDVRFRTDPTVTAAVNGNFFLGSGSAVSARATINALVRLERRLARRHGPTAAQRRLLSRRQREALLIALPTEVDWLDSTAATILRFGPPSGPLDVLELAAANTSSSSSSSTIKIPSASK
ncbi:MAG: hypothetical protein QOF77_698 [Solirubrobacteraceae bacterium]|jgi:hypothetical protein|nr:hypothetical protein [Solirubrobacteraceae bacterium]